MTAPGDHLGDALSGLLDGELPTGAEAAARRHLTACHDCALELEAVQTARAWVRNLPPVEPPFGFYERLLLEDRGPAPVRSLWPWPWPGAMSRRRVPAFAAFTASAAAAVTLLGFASPSESPVSPPVNRLVEAHATGASVGSDPLSGLAPLGVPVSVRR
ncbi:MAG: anti-sigma factor family protein [Acidimicrobiales bacterium]